MSKRVSKRTQAILLVALPTVILGFSALTFPEQRSNLALAAVVLGLTAVLVYLLWTVGWSTRGHRPLASLLAVRDRPADRPSDLAAFERMLGWQVYTAPEFNHRVRPLLRSILGARLRETRGIDIDDPNASPGALPEALLPLVAPRSADIDPESKVRTADLLVLADRLEEL